MQEKKLGELIFCTNTCGACIRTCANTENIFEGSFFRKIRAPIKIKSALPPPPKTPPQKGEFYGHGFSCRKNAFFPGVHKIGAPISGPRIADTNFTDTRIFLNFLHINQILEGFISVQIHVAPVFAPARIQENAPGELLMYSEPPVWGRQKGGTPICSDLFRFPRFLPISSDLCSMFSGMPRFVPICSVFCKFVPICFQNKSAQIRETPFCRPLLQIPDVLVSCQ